MSNVKLVVKNKGPIHSPSAYVFFDDLNGAVINSITPSKGEYRDGLWTIGNLDIDETAEIVIDASPSTGIYQTITATCYGSVIDSDTSNNKAYFDITASTGAACEVKLELYDGGEVYTQFSIRTVPFEECITKVNESGGEVYHRHTLFGDGGGSFVGEWVGGVPTEWGHPTYTPEVGVDVEYTTDSNNVLLYGTFSVHFDFMFWDGYPDIFVRKSTDPLYFRRFPREIQLPANSVAEIEAFIEDLTKTPLCMTVTGTVECPPIVTSNMELSDVSWWSGYNLRTPISMDLNGVPASSLPAFVQHHQKFDFYNEDHPYVDILDSTVLFAYTKEDGVIKGSMQHPITDVEYIFITHLESTDTYFAMFSWGKVELFYDHVYNTMRVPNISLMGDLDLGDYSMGVNLEASLHWGTGDVAIPDSGHEYLTTFTQRGDRDVDISKIDRIILEAYEYMPG